MVREVGDGYNQLKVSSNDISVGRQDADSPRDPSLEQSRISLKVMLRIMRKGGGVLLESNRLENNTSTQAPVALLSSVTSWTYFRWCLRFPVCCREGTSNAIMK